MTDNQVKQGLYSRLLKAHNFCGDEVPVPVEVLGYLETLCELVEKDIAQNTQKIEQLNARTMGSARYSL